MLAKAISHKRHSLYTFAIAQLDFETADNFDAAIKYMIGAYGPGIHHDREELIHGYRRNTGCNKVWYYSNKKEWRGNAMIRRVYLTTPEQITMASLLFN